MNYHLLTFLLIGIAWSLLSFAHHNSASHYDLNALDEIEGVVTRYRIINPHARIYFDVTREDGTVENWMAEGDAAAVLLRRGWTGDELKPGDHIKIRGNPSRDGRPIIEWISITLPDGRELLGGNLLPEERKRNMSNLEKTPSCPA